MGNRRSFLKASGILLAASALPLSSFMIPQRKTKLGVALVGLGYYSTDILAPALQLTKYCELRGIVTGSPEKIPVWQKKYNIPDANVYNYENMHTIANNDDIDIVYIVLPNALHKPYSIIGAKAGKHVWCEKPMAMNVSECEAIIQACNKNKVQLTIGYRLQHEPVTQTIIKWSQTKPYGPINSLFAEAGFYNSARNHKHWKLHKTLGGGAMYDMGVYPLNAVRYATGLEPISVSATHEYTRPNIFTADEITHFNLEFPNGITAQCKTSFAENINTMKVDCANGWYKAEPLQYYSGVSVQGSDGQKVSPFQGNQQAKQMDEDALAIIKNMAPIVPGEEGLKDINVVEAIYKSAANNGKKIMIT
ncbi:Gfo/Idh/MocA family protein [Mangrovimonas sp. YM274]|uniref:Gfo/Idh/MocA family protein n=1 Tax=Mangrovimonas sp. YM274 TaxID=3070660 RepID=UPI0027DD9EFD|nr:Gfo/Idh/MocA family oxidoreductase [Mangrovimonas sp. YM274]WMI67154.1 Gfo/Idh/MocA family oxidoreductase [Mangrovimonas sp. YM274]